jgi:hypothetical protein
MTDPKETYSMTSDSLFCRRCSRETSPAFGVLAAKHDDPDPRFRTRVVGEFSPRHSGPYCRSCAYDRQHELRQQDRRSAKRKQAETFVENVERDDCTLIAMMKTTGRAYSAVQTAARKVGYRPGCGGLSMWQQQERAGYLGFRLVQAFDRGPGPMKMTTGDLIRTAKRQGMTGILYVRTLGHAFPVDLDAERVFNGNRSHRVISVHRAEKISEMGQIV